jgi:hypothetical protein
MVIVMKMTLTPHQERCVAVRAGCDPRTVRIRLTNLARPKDERRRQDSTIEARVDDALRAEGFWPVAEVAA